MRAEVLEASLNPSKTISANKHERAHAFNLAV